MFDDDDQEKPLGLRPRIPASQNPMEIPAIASPQMAQMKPAVNLPGVSVAPSPTQAQTDTNELDRLKTTGSGISQIKNPVGRTLATIGNVAASLISPGLASRIPGTTEHHDQLVNNQEGIVNNDIKGAQEQAQTAHLNQETASAANPQPKPTEEEWSLTPDGSARIEKHSGQVVPIDGAHGKVIPPHISYDSGIPVSVTDSKGTVYDVNDPKLPPELKPLVDSANRAHKQKIDEAAASQASVFAHSDAVAQRNAATAENKHSATESAQVERESRQNIRKAADKYLDTKRSVDQISASIDAAKDGNGLITSFVPTMEVLGINTSNGVHRISPAEAQAANLPGGWAEQFNAWFSKASSGKPTPQLIAEGKQLAAILKKGAYQQYKDTHDYESGVVSGYGGKDFDKRVPLIPGEDQQQQAPQYKVGDKVKLRDGSTLTIKAVHPDGSFE